MFVISCQDAGARRHGIEIFDRDQHLLALATDTPYATGPVFSADGTAVMVTHHGAVVEARPDVPSN